MQQQNILVRLASLVALACYTPSGSAQVERAHSSSEQGVVVDRVVFEGLQRTERGTLVELLPRPAPASYTHGEIREFRRRVANLELFDRVDVSVRGRELHVTVREKFSISPIFDFTTGKTLADSSGALGVVENNLWGNGTRLGGVVKYSQRGPQVQVWLKEHQYRPRRWQRDLVLAYEGSSFRFADTPQKWQRSRARAEVELKNPFSYRSPFRYEVVVDTYYEFPTFRRNGADPSDGWFVGSKSELIWDQYSWNDLTPHGFLIEAQLEPGGFIGPTEPRHYAAVLVEAGIVFSSATALAFQAEGEIVNAGNVNHSVLLGSQRGVRGLKDSFYRNQAHAFSNIELRHAFTLAPRIYLQPVAFVDSAVFRPMDSLGEVTTWQEALSVGLGLRFIPTALVDTLLRLDVSQLLAPDDALFLQFGINQYF